MNIELKTNVSWEVECEVMGKTEIKGIAWEIKITYLPSTGMYGILTGDGLEEYQ